MYGFPIFDSYAFANKENYPTGSISDKIHPSFSIKRDVLINIVVVGSDKTEIHVYLELYKCRIVLRQIVLDIGIQ